MRPFDLADWDEEDQIDIEIVVNGTCTKIISDLDQAISHLKELKYYQESVDNARAAYKKTPEYMSYAHIKKSWEYFKKDSETPWEAFARRDKEEAR